jgi:hypothetical protein
MQKIKARKSPSKKAAAKKLPQKKALSKRRRLVREMGEEKGKKTYELSVVSHRILMEHLNVQTFGEVLEEARKHRIAQPFVRMSNENYHRAIGIALALYYAVLTDPHGEERLEELSEEIGYKPTKRSPWAHIIVRAVINYGRTAEEKTLGRKHAQRDAAAIQYLAEQGISPEDVVALGKKKGEGLEAWATAWGNRKKELADSGGETSDESGPQKKDNQAQDEDDQQQEDQQQEDEEQEDQEHEPDGLENEDEADQDRDKVPAVTLAIIKQIVQKGPILRHSGDDDEITWAVVAVKLTEPLRTEAKRKRALAEALQKYARQLNKLAS